VISFREMNSRCDDRFEFSLIANAVIHCMFIHMVTPGVSLKDYISRLVLSLHITRSVVLVLAEQRVPCC